MATLAAPPDYGGIRSMIRKAAFIMLLAAALVLQGYLAYFINTDHLVTANDREVYNGVGFSVMVLLAAGGVLAATMWSAWRLLLLASLCLVMGTVAHQIFGSVTSPNQARLSALGGAVFALAALFTDILHPRRAGNGNASRASAQ